MANTIDITFLGTSSAQPSVTRSHSSLAVRINGTIWLFDAGEGIQRQLMYSTLKLGKINKVFITHLHGDHIYGLPGLVCTLTGALNPQNHSNETIEKSDGDIDELKIESKDPETTPCLEIYGPEGLRNYLRSALMFTYSRLPIYYRVHELILPKEEAKEIAEVYAQDKERDGFIKLREKFKQQINSDILHPDELMGEDIQPDADGYFRDLLQVEKKYDNGKNNKSKKFKTNPIRDKIHVSASYIKHSVPTLGYVLEERDLRGNIKMELVKPILLRNKEALEKMGIKQPLSLIRDLKNGKKLELPDGSTIIPEDVITPTEQRKIVILGDTYNPSKIIPLAQNPTILVHEATNMYEGVEDGSEEAIQAAEQYRIKVMGRGHSTPEMAGAFAAKLKANTLILNHFSSRYASLNHMAMIQPGWGRREETTLNETNKDEKGRNGKKSKHDYTEVTLELKKRTQELGYPYPYNPLKRDLLSEQEKLQLKMKDKFVGGGGGDEGSDGTSSDSGSNKSEERGVITFAQQKLLKDWEIMEKIRSKAASTFKPTHHDRIILADDFLQVEINRAKLNKDNDKEKEKEKEKVTVNVKVNVKENESENDNESCQSGSENSIYSNNNNNNNNSMTIPIYMAWNQVLI